MNKEQQIEEIEQFIYDYVDSKQTERVYLLGSRVNKLAKPFVHNKGIAEALFNAGYRKTFTSDLASDTQKAYKEGYIKGIEEIESEIEILKIQNKNRGYQPLPITTKPALPKCPTPSPKSISIDTVKEMNAMCNIDEQRKQAVKEFAEKLKERLCVFFDENENNDGSIDKGILLVDIIGVEAKNGDTISIGMIDKLLKEYEND